MASTPTQSDRADFRQYCRNVSERQLPNVYQKELDAGRLAYADDARLVAAERGIDLD